MWLKSALRQALCWSRRWAGMAHFFLIPLWSNADTTCSKVPKFPRHFGRLGYCRDDINIQFISHSPINNPFVSIVIQTSGLCSTQRSPGQPISPFRGKPPCPAADSPCHCARWLCDGRRWSRTWQPTPHDGETALWMNFGGWTSPIGGDPSAMFCHIFLWVHPQQKKNFNGLISRKIIRGTQWRFTFTTIFLYRDFLLTWSYSKFPRNRSVDI